MRTRIALTAAVAALALIAVGCGGDDGDSNTDPTAAWASDFCGAITTWTDELQTVTSQFSDTSNLSQEGLESESSLKDFSIGKVPLSASIEETVDGISGLTGIPSAITAVTTSLTAMGNAFASTLQTIEAADAGSELQTALEDSPECANISS